VGNLSATRVCRRAGPEQPRVVDVGEEVPAEEGGLAVEIGERVAVHLTIRNRGLLPVPWVLMEDALPRQALDVRSRKRGVKGRRLQVGMVGGGGELQMKYQVECLGRGYHQIGPLVLEGGDLFGLHRRFRVEAEPAFVLVYPRVVPLAGYDLA